MNRGGKTMNNEARFVSSRKFTMDDIEKRLKNPMQTCAFEVELDDDDHRYEDTILLPIAAPRIVWKLLYAASLGTKTTVQDVASEWLSDTAMDMVENMKPLRDAAVGR